MKKNITIGFSTRHENLDYVDYLKKTCGLKDVEIIQIVNNNSKSLTEVYNEIIKKSTNDYVVLCHDDLLFDTHNWGKKIITHLEKNSHDIIGVAGTTNISNSGRWWDDRSKMVGIVNHLHEGKKWESKYSKSYGNEIIDVCLIDGLFICFNKKNIKSFFDEKITGFHFYDFGFCVDNFLKDLKIGVIFDVRITHKSIGVTNESWEKNRNFIVKKYESILPISVTPNLEYNLFKNKIIKTKFNLIIQTNSDFDCLNNLLNKIKDFSIQNIKINLLSDSSNYEKLKLFSEPNIIIYEGFFDELNKNLSVLKWEENLISEKDEIIILFSKPIEVLNNIFYSISNTYKKEKNKLGCIFPISMHNDKTIFSSGIEFLINNESKVQINIIDLGSFYNVLNGYKKSNFGSLSDIIATTPTILKKFDWLEVRHNTPIFFNYFATKCTENKLNVFVDTNAICTQLSFSNDNSKEKLNGDFQDLLTYINSKENLQKLLIKYQ